MPANVFRKIASAVLPRKLKSALKRLFRIPKSIAVYKKKAAGKIVTKQDIINGLRQLGIKERDTIFVHSSLGAFGFVEGGAQAVIDALLESVGSNGNVCMPSFGPLPDGKTFDVGKTASGVGKVSDIFWRMPNAKRSLSPTHCVACIGKHAVEITEGHLLDETPFTKNSPYYKMMQLDGKVVALGSPLRRSLTCNYIFEDMVGGRFPVKVYAAEKKEFVVIDEKGRKQIVKKKVHDLALDPIRIDYNPELADWFEGLLIERKCMRKGKIGEATVLVYGIKCLIDTLADLLKEGKTIYAVEKSIGNKKGTE